MRAIPSKIQLVCVSEIRILLFTCTLVHQFLKQFANEDRSNLYYVWQVELDWTEYYDQTRLDYIRLGWIINNLIYV